MRVLWVCNIMLPRIAEALHETTEPVGGWMSGLLDSLESSEVEIGIVFPTTKTEKIQGVTGKVSFYGVYQPSLVMTEYSKEIEQQMRSVMDDFKADVLHVFGTEYVHSLAAVNAFNNPARTVIGIQGLLSAYAKHFMAGIPAWVQKGCTFRDIVKRDNLLHQKAMFEKRAVFEIEAIEKAGHIIGRTDWDKACTEQINPKAYYHFCNEILRERFYHEKWSVENCDRHSIFVSQGSYPIKGFHYLLEAMPKILERFPDTKVYVAGGDITKKETWKDRLRMTSYGKYLCGLMDQYHLWNVVSFTGFLNESRMCEHFLRAHVFVSPSSIENSPNSVGEAMLLGMPVVSSDVGGVKNMLTHEKEGFIYQADAAYMISYYVNKIFENDDLALELGNAACKKATHTHSREINSRTMLDIYYTIMNS